MWPVFDYELTAGTKEALICVINITSQLANNFTIDQKSHYEKIMKSLAERIVLENRLKKIKGIIHEQQSAFIKQGA